MPSTTTLFSSGSTRRTRAVVRALAVPASSPVMISTMSSLRMCMSHHLGCQADDLQEAPFAQLAGDRPEDPRAARVLLGVNQDEGIAIEAHVAPILAARRFLQPDNHALDHVPRL